MTEQLVEENQWQMLTVDNDYEILKDEPYTIRKRSNGFIPTLSTNHEGYKTLKLNQVEFRLHRVLALQFIPNPENLPQIDHINRIKSDNHLENLRWVSQSENQQNRNSGNGVQYEYVDELSDEAIEITDYGVYKFEFYYYDNNDFWFYNGLQYRKLHLNQNKKQYAYYVQVIDVNDKKTKIAVNKFKKLYKILFDYNNKISIFIIFQMEYLYQFAETLGKEHNASDYEVFKIFETLIDDKELDDFQQQYYDQKKQECERFGIISDKTQEIIGYLQYLNTLSQVN